MRDPYSGIKIRSKVKTSDWRPRASQYTARHEARSAMIPEMTRPTNIPRVGPVLMIDKLNARFPEELSSDTSGSNNCVTGVNNAERNVKVRNGVYPSDTQIPSLHRTGDEHNRLEGGSSKKKHLPEDGREGHQDQRETAPRKVIRQRKDHEQADGISSLGQSRNVADL